VQDLADPIVGIDAGQPLLIVLEDLHWADDLSLEVLGQLAARLADRPVLLAGAYRSDELYPRLPMRELRARPVSQRLAEEIRLPRLTAGQTATMASATLGRPVPAQLVAAIQERSDGIPLHVEGLLAAITDDALTPPSGAAVQATAVPETLGDAVLSRAQRLSSTARSVASSAAAVIGRSFDLDLLIATAGASPDEVTGALRELQDAYFVVGGSDADRFDFRPALIRDALYADTDLALRRRLHHHVARTAVARGYGDAFTSSHFEQAGQPGLALCERGYEASAGITDAAYLFPFLLTGVRAHCALGQADAAESWLDRRQPRTAQRRGGTATRLAASRAAHAAVAPAHRPRIRDRPAHRRRPDQQADRRAAGASPQDDLGPRRAHPGETRCRAPRRDRRLVLSGPDQDPAVLRNAAVGASAG
jgi:hypothetical protein